MDKLQAMSAFVAVAETGGFAKGARKLKLSPSAVTRAVSELEAKLGIQLFIRTTRVVRLTEAGEQYVHDCRRIFEELRAAEDGLAGDALEPHGKLTITSPVMFGRMFVAPLVAAYLHRHPRVEVSCLFLDRVVNLVEEGIDVAVRIGDLPDSGLVATAVGRVRRVIVASPGYLARLASPQVPADLRKHTLISATGVSPLSEWDLTVEGKSVRLPVRPRATTTTNDAAIALAEQGVGLARLLSYQVGPQLRDGRLKTVLESFEPPPLPVHVIHLRGRKSVSRIRAFTEMAVSALRRDKTIN